MATYINQRCIEISNRAEKLAEQILPQAGRIVLDVYNINSLLNEITALKHEDVKGINVSDLFDWCNTAAEVIGEIIRVANEAETVPEDNRAAQDLQQLLALRERILAGQPLWQTEIVKAPNAGTLKMEG